MHSTVRNHLLYWDAMSLQPVTSLPGIQEDPRLSLSSDSVESQLPVESLLNVMILMGPFQLQIFWILW